MENEMCGKNRQIQAIRFFGFLYIFVLHSSDLFPNESLLRIIKPGIGAEWGVTLFVVLSGFLLGTKAQSFSNHITIYEAFKFTWKKIKKLYPLHFITTLLMIPFMGWYCLDDSIRRVVMLDNLKHLFYNLTFLKVWTNTYYSYNDVSWFLCMMLPLWFITPYLVSIIRNQNKNRVTYWLLVDLVVLFLGYLVWIWFVKKYFPADIERWCYINPIARVWEYVCGVLVGYVVANRSDFSYEHQSVTVPKLGGESLLYLKLE